MIRRVRFSVFAWSALVYNIVVVLWGAVVRASVSGDGCGKHWPFCDGQLVPTIHRTATVIEYAHRLSTGLALVVLAILAVWGYRRYPPGHPTRSGLTLAIFFTFTEALLGAGLVLFGLVAHNDSVNRAVVMSAHLVNTLLLLASLALTAWWSGGGAPVSLRGQGTVAIALGIGLGAALLLAVSGSITALVDTLYPASSLRAALHQDIYPGVHYLIRLRILHPFIAVAVGLYSMMLASSVSRLRDSYDTRRFARSIGLLVLVEIACGFVNLLLLAPIWIQLIHLLLADLLWICLVLLAASTLTKRYSFIEEH